MVSNLSLRLSSVLFTLLLLLGLPYLASLKTGRPFMEWTLVIGVLITSGIFYCHGPGYRAFVENTKNRVFRSPPFWISLIYTLVVSCLTYIYYGKYF
jgi:hypothetical protein